MLRDCVGSLPLLLSWHGRRAPDVPTQVSLYLSLSPAQPLTDVSQAELVDPRHAFHGHHPDLRRSPQVHSAPQSGRLCGAGNLLLIKGPDVQQVSNTKSS